MSCVMCHDGGIMGGCGVCVKMCCVGGFMWVCLWELNWPPNVWSLVECVYQVGWVGMVPKGTQMVWVLWDEI